MNNYIIILLFPLILLSNTCLSQSLHFDTTVFDLGTLVHGSRVNVTTKFTNNGNKTINGLVFKSSGGGQLAKCVNCDSIQPGKSGFIRIDYCTPQIGKFYKSIEVLSLDYKNEKTILYIKGNSIAPSNIDTL